MKEQKIPFYCIWKIIGEEVLVIGIYNIYIERERELNNKFIENKARGYASETRISNLHIINVGQVNVTLNRIFIVPFLHY